MVKSYRTAKYLPEPTVHLLCGLNGAGKTTRTRQLEDGLPGVRFSLDEWMLRSFPDLSYNTDAYGLQAEVCKDLIWDVALQVLRVGSDVILDWNQWNRQRRAFWKDRALEAGYAVCLHYVRTPLDVAIRQAEHRAAQGTPWAHRLDAAQILQFTEIFEEPSEDEELRIILA